MKYHLLVLVAVFSLNVHRECSAKHVLTIGALFHEDEDDLAMSFVYALQQRNTFYHDIVFHGEIEKVQRSDSFSTYKKICNWTQHGNGIVAIVGPTSAKTSIMSESIARALEILNIQVQWKPQKGPPKLFGDTSVVINFYPDQDLLAQAIATTVKSLQWKNYIIIYEDTDSLVRLQDVLKIVQSNNDPVIIRQLIGDDYRTVLKEFKEELVYNIILDCRPHICWEVLKQAKEIGFLDFFYSYFLSHLDSHALNISSLNTKANITTLRLVDPSRKTIRQAVKNWELGEVHHNNREMNITPETVRTELALMDDAISHLTDTISQLNMIEPVRSKKLSCDSNERWDDGMRVASFMTAHPKNDGDTGTSKFNNQGRRTTFTLDLIEFDRGVPEKIAEWSSDKKNEVAPTRSESRKQEMILGNLQDELIIVSSKLGEPYLSERTREYTGEPLQGNARFYGYSLDVIDAIAQILNFTYEFRLTKDNTNGAYNPKTKQWNGIMRDLIDRKAHLAICDLTITEERRSVVDFSTPYMTLGISILYKKQQAGEVPLWAFLDPLETEVWLYIVTALSILPLIMYLLTRMAPGDWVNPQPLNKNPTELENVWTLKNCLWLVLGSTMSCGCYIMPKGISSRMGISMWWFLILIITNSYKANLAAFLTKRGLGAPIDSAEALSKQTKIKYGTVQGGSTQNFFRDAKTKVYRKMWQDMIQASPSVFEKTNGDGVKRVLNAKNQGYAFLMESTQIEYEIAKNCSLKQVGHLLDNKGYGIAMPIDSPYRVTINEAILKLQENGTLRILKNRWWKEMLNATACEEEEVKNDQAFTYANVKGVFIVLVAGIGLAFLFTVIDFLWHAREISIREHVSYLEALTVQMQFAIKLLEDRKRAKHKTPSVSESRSIENLRNEVKDSLFDLNSVR